MLYYDRIDIREGIHPAKYNGNKECMICHYWLSNHRFKVQSCVWNGCHDLAILCLNISGIGIITVSNVDYGCIIHDIEKSEAMNLLKNIVLEDRGYI